MPFSSELEILLVDDNELHRELISRMLQHVGYSADIVTNGLEALEALESKEYQLILMDLAMPHLDGFDTTRSIRNSETESAPYIIAITALNIDAPKETIREAGMDDVLLKPVLLNDFRAALDRYQQNRIAA